MTMEISTPCHARLKTLPVDLKVKIKILSKI